MKNLFRFSLFCLLMSFIGLVFADQGYSSGIAVAPNDYSLKFLGYIFGQVGDIIPGQGPSNTLLGVMFKQFNYGVTMCAIFIFAYIYGKGIIDTAAEGQFLGKKANSLWVPLRGVFGLLLLVPSSYSGYNIAQVGSMWMLKQGIGIADQVWNTAVVYLSANRATTLAVGTDIYTATDQGKYKDLVKQIFQLLVCEETGIKQFPGSYADNQEWTTTYKDQAVVVGYKFSYQRQINSVEGVKYAPVICGTVNWSNIPYHATTSKDGKITIDTSVDNGINKENVNSQDTDGSELNTLYQNIVYNIMGTFIPIANYYVDQNWDSSKKPKDMDFPVSLANSDGVNVYNFAGTNFIYEATQMAMNQLAMYKQEEIQDIQSYSSIDGTYISQGWIMAGAYWYNFRGKKGGDTPYPTTVAEVKPTTNVTGDSKYKNPFDSAGKYSDAVYNTYQSNDSSGSLRNLIISYGAGIAIATGIATAGLAGFVPVIIPIGIAVGTVVIAGVSVMAVITEGSDPIFTLSILGHIMVGTASALWAGIFITLFFTLLPANIMRCMNPLGATYTTTTTAMAVMGFALVGSFFAFGSMLAIYLPMLPYLYFTLGAIHYFLLVLELMIIIVIGVLGMMMPEGQHDLWGMAQQAVFFLISAFLRPVMMIIGLMAAGLIVNVAIRLINAGFYSALMGVTGNGASLANPVEALLIIFLYAGLCVTACTIPFRLINRVPDVALQGINFGQARVEAEQDLGMARKGFETGGKAMGEGSKQMGKSFAGDVVKHGKETPEAQKTANVSGGATPQASGGAQQAQAASGSQERNKGEGH